MIGVCTDDGECVGGPELRLLRRNLLTVTSGVGRDTKTRFRQRQAQVKSKDRSAKTECQNREEWGHHVPNRKSDGNLDRGPCENQSAGGSLSGGGTSVGGIGG